MKISEVGYFTENVVPEYTKGLTKADTLPKLLLFLKGWEGLADDAIAWAKTMTEKDFRAFRRCLKIERSGKFSGEQYAPMVGTLTMPDLMLRASVAESTYHVPWGTAVIRLKEVSAK